MSRIMPLLGLLLLVAASVTTIEAFSTMKPMFPVRTIVPSREVQSTGVASMSFQMNNPPSPPQKKKNKTLQLNLATSAVGDIVGGTNTIAWVLFHVLGGLIGLPPVAQAVNKKTGWYDRIDLPPWTPPSRVFTPVWTTLYTLMGIAVSRVVAKTPPAGYKSSLILAWLVRFAFVQTWPFVFFGAKRLRLGLIHNVLQLSSLIGMIYLFYQNNPLSGYLLLPYLAWQVFATLLNLDICKRNPTINGYNDAMLQAQISDLQQQAAAYAGC